MSPREAATIAATAIIVPELAESQPARFSSECSSPPVNLCAFAHPRPALPPSLQSRFRSSPACRLEYAMTWSIVARDRSGAFGIAIASRFFAVGVLCPHVKSGVGALSTQALVNPLYGARALDLMAQGVAPVEVVSSLIAADEGREHRQLH